MGEEQNLATKFWELYDKIGLKDVVKIHKRAKNGEILMKLLRSADANAVKDRIDAELKEGQKTTVVTEMTEMVVTNLDLTATVEEVSEAVGTKLGRSVPPASIKLWRCQDGLQRARFRFPIKQASKVDGSEVTIGAKVCGLKISKPMAATQMRCFRCLERGHLSNACEGIDRSEKCLQCGGEDHRSKDCTDRARCLNCGGRHRIGSSRCKKAVRSG
uniref:CCHC-type domain-containing protein n=1 Tax=Anopheles dirus TaxID=7168 RepID=A0A182MY26_9DIPT